MECRRIKFSYLLQSQLPPLLFQHPRGLAHDWSHNHDVWQDQTQPTVLFVPSLSYDDKMHYSPPLSRNLHIALQSKDVLHTLSDMVHAYTEPIPHNHVNAPDAPHLLYDTNFSEIYLRSFQRLPLVSLFLYLPLISVGHL